MKFKFNPDALVGPAQFCTHIAISLLLKRDCLIIIQWITVRCRLTGMESN